MPLCYSQKAAQFTQKVQLPKGPEVPTGAVWHQPELMTTHQAASHPLRDYMKSVECAQAITDLSLDIALSPPTSMCLSDPFTLEHCAVPEAVLCRTSPHTDSWAQRSPEC